MPATRERRPTGWSPWPCGPAPPTTSPSWSATSSTSANAPPTQPQVVGAAAVRETGTRPIPTTPAAKAAALTAQATGAGTDDGVTLAEEGPRSRRGTVLRVAAIALVLLVVTAGSSYAGYAWSQRQYYLAEQDGVVAVFRGVEQNLGPISLSRPEFATTIALDDLPTSYQDSLKQGIEVDDRAAADVRVAELRLQATACRWAQLNGETCRTVPATWTAPTPSPSPTASPTPSSSATPTPTAPFSPGATPSIAPTVQPTVPPSAVATGGPVTS